MSQQLMGKVVIKANDMTAKMTKFATKVGVDALRNAQTEQVRVGASTCLAASTLSSILPFQLLACAALCYVSVSLPR